ncbi:hypothetical protein SALBM311S_00343 [Streptomyces alboniger]
MCIKRVHARVHALCSHAEDEDGVKRVPVARAFRYPADTRPAHKCYNMCPIAIGS